jgi:hypothetical protein
MRVTVTLALEIPDHEVSVKSIDQAVREAVPEFVSAAWQRWVREVEDQAWWAHPAGAMRVKSWEQRTLWTTAGPVRFKRRRFEVAGERKGLLLFDLRTGLQGWQRNTPGAERLMAEAAADVPGYALAARSLGRCWGETPGAMQVWTAVQRVGRQLRREREALRRMVFWDGELPGWERPAPEFLALEADSTYLAAWRGLGPDHEVFVGIGYTGKHQRGRRRRLADKLVCSRLGRAEEFGQEFFAAAQERYNLVETRSGLFMNDGDGRLRRMRQEHFPRFVPQLDWRHMSCNLEEAYGPARRERSKEVLGLLYAGRYPEACRQVRGDAGRLRSRGEQLRQLVGYLEGPGQELYGSRRLRRLGVRLPPHMEGTGGIERNIGVLVVQRMKRRGMGWTHNGAANLLAVRNALFNHSHTS